MCLFIRSGKIFYYWNEEKPYTSNGKQVHIHLYMYNASGIQKGYYIKDIARGGGHI